MLKKGHQRAAGYDHLCFIHENPFTSQNLHDGCNLLAETVHNQCPEIHANLSKTMRGESTAP
jgi:hypothetical protein